MHINIVLESLTNIKFHNWSVSAECVIESRDVFEYLTEIKRNLIQMDF